RRTAVGGLPPRVQPRLRSGPADPGRGRAPPDRPPRARARRRAARLHQRLLVGVGPGGGRMPDPTLPIPDRDSAPYWAALAAGRVEIQQCLDCGHWTWPPRPICSKGPRENLAWRAIRGTGEVHSWVRLHRPVFPSLKDLVPFDIVLG